MLQSKLRDLLGSVALALALSACSAGNEAPEQSIAAIAFPGGPGSAQARFTRRSDGMPLVSWLEPDGDRVRLRYAVWAGEGFGTPVDVASGENWFINWADFPSVLPVTEDFWVAHWLVLQPDSFGAYDAVIAVSNDGGTSFGEPEPLNEDATEAEHGFVELFASGGAAAAVWLDGRELANWSFDNPGELLGVSLRVANIDRMGTISDRQIVDDLVCDCCQPDVVQTADGPLIAYRDRSEAEIRDIVVRRGTAAGWSDPVEAGGDDWFIEGCPVNGPAIAASGDVVVLAWFTAAGGDAAVRFARSVDGGRLFLPAFDLDRGAVYGQVGLQLDANGSAYVSWWRRAASGGIDLVVSAVTADGAQAAPIVVGHNDEAQPIDVPQIIAIDDRLLIAWTTFADGGAVRTVSIAKPR